MQHHRYSFFGQKTAVLLDSAKWSDPYLFLRFLKKLPDRWEKPSLKEGKIIKINLLELIALLRVCHASQASKFETFHKFQGNNTQIRFEKKNEGQLVISITGYQKYLNVEETVLLTKLLEHLLEEKIIHATGVKDSRNLGQNTGPGAPQTLSTKPRPIYANSLQPPSQTTKQQPPKIKNTTPQPPSPSSDASVIDPTQWFSALQQENEYKLVPGEILARSERAISFQVAQFHPIWVPVSCLGPETPDNNSLWVKEWFLRKKLEDIFPQAV